MVTFFNQTLCGNLKAKLTHIYDGGQCYERCSPLAKGDEVRRGDEARRGDEVRRGDASSPFTGEAWRVQNGDAARRQGVISFYFIFSKKDLV